MLERQQSCEIAVGCRLRTSEANARSKNTTDRSERQLFILFLCNKYFKGCSVQFSHYCLSPALSCYNLAMIFILHPIPLHLFRDSKDPVLFCLFRRRRFGDSTRVPGSIPGPVAFLDVYVCFLTKTCKLGTLNCPSLGVSVSANGRGSFCAALQ